MDPYLEHPGDWQGFHTALLVHLQEGLAARVGAAYRVKLEQKLYIKQDEDDPGPRRPFAVADVGVVPHPRPAAGGVAVAAEPTAPVVGVIPLPAGVRRPRRWLTIRDKAGRRVVTVVELLSPTDKRLGPDRENYLAKRARLLGSAASLVEIDLLRGGHRTPVEGRPVCDYCVVVSRPGRRPAADIWAWGVRDPMPVVPIPLRDGEAEPVIDLRAVLDQCYDAGRLGDGLYDDPPEPSLAASDAAWAATLLPPRRRRRRPG
jgi:hypothetical protein